jgi:hypothetical protein
VEGSDSVGSNLHVSLANRYESAGHAPA